MKLAKDSVAQAFCTVAIGAAVKSAPFVVIGTYQFISNVAATALFGPRR